MILIQLVREGLESLHSNRLPGGAVEAGPKIMAGRALASQVILPPVLSRVVVWTLMKREVLSPSSPSVGSPFPLASGHTANLRSFQDAPSCVQLFSAWGVEDVLPRRPSPSPPGIGSRPAPPAALLRGPPG